MISLLDRRRAMMTHAETAPAYVKGSWTQSGNSTTHSITHNLDTSNYVVIYRNANIRTGVSAVMEGCLLVGLITDYNYVSVGTQRTETAYVSEARNGESQYFANTLNINPNTSGKNEAVLPARSSSYPFMDGETYEWIAFDYEKISPSIVTLEEGTTELTLTNTADSSDVLVMALRDGMPSTNAYGTIVGVLSSGFFSTDSIDEVVLTTTPSNANSIINKPSSGWSVTISSITLASQNNINKWRTGDYKVYIIKYKA